MKAMRLHSVGGSLELEELPKPKPGPREALVKIRACGAGLTIHHAITGNSPVNLPVVLGHEVAAEVVELGPEAEGLAIGDRVTAYFYLFCGRCRFCLTRREPLCENLGGYIGRQIDGGYAEDMVAPDRNFIQLPEGLPYDEDPAAVAVICDAIATPYKITRRARLQPLETIAIFGAAGGVGIHLVQIARMLGARVIGIDLGDKKLAAASDAGAHELIDASTENPTEGIKRLTGGKGADIVVDFVGNSQTLQAGLDGLGPGGRLVIIGVARQGEFRVQPGIMLRGEQEVLGSRYVTRWEVAESLELVARGLVKPIVNYRFPLKQANEAHALVGKGESIGRVALVMD
jgi:propanol-preferring alcohol dehydrogenase